jgi:hypothetical protein
MKRFVCALGAVAMLLWIASTGRPAGAQDEKPPTVKAVMEKLHKGANSPLGQLKKAARAEAPDWPAIQKTTKDFVILGAAMAKNDPPKGDKGSWEKLTGAYFEDSKATDDAAKKEDKAAFQAGVGKLSGSCMACHRSHRPAAK